jgi:hypothetical protein
VAPIIVAAIPIPNDLNVDALLIYLEMILNGLLTRGVRVVSYAAAVSYTPPWVAVDSLWTPSKLLVYSIYSTWTPCGLLVYSIYSIWTPGGLHMDSTRTPCGLHLKSILAGEDLQ